MVQIKKKNVTSSVCSEVNSTFYPVCFLEQESKQQMNQFSCINEAQINGSLHGNSLSSLNLLMTSNRANPVI